MTHFVDLKPKQVSTVSGKGGEAIVGAESGVSRALPTEEIKLMHGYELKLRQIDQMTVELTFVCSIGYQQDYKGILGSGPDARPELNEHQPEQALGCLRRTVCVGPSVAADVLGRLRSIESFLNYYPDHASNLNVEKTLERLMRSLALTKDIEGFLQSSLLGKVLSYQMKPNVKVLDGFATD
ncbi:MAG: hypothetical protein KDD62_04365 [Bdellovibrionales bacterium]|nr:hypothetical protein [Bdellovibrionales bacterium]